MGIGWIMTMKTPIHALGIMIMLTGLWVAYQAAFVDAAIVPFAHEIFFSKDLGFMNFFSPFVCFIFYVMIGNALAFIVVAILGTLLGYKIQAAGLNGVAICLSLGERKSQK
jgi:hypothetical protein